MNTQDVDWYNQLVDRLRTEIEELRQLLAYVISDDYDCGSYYHNFCGCMTRLRDEVERRLSLVPTGEKTDDRHS